MMNCGFFRTNLFGGFRPRPRDNPGCGWRYGDDVPVFGRREIFGQKTEKGPPHGRSLSCEAGRAPGTTDQDSISGVCICSLVTPNFAP